MNPQPKRETPLQRTLLRALARGGWRTANELAPRTGRPRRDVMDSLLQLRDEGKALAAVTPVRYERVFFHRVTPDTQAQALIREPFLIPITRLPWPLMKSLAEKLELRHRKGLEENPPGWLKGLLVFEEHLDRMGLITSHPRPDLGFPYPCEWRTDHNEGTFNPPIKVYQFIMKFTGTLGRDLTKQLIPHPETHFSVHMPVQVRDWNYDTMNKLVLSQGRLHIELERVAYVAVNRKTLRLETCPTREEIVQETKKRLWDAATNAELNDEYLAAFQPFQSPIRVRLLSNASAEAPH